MGTILHYIKRALFDWALIFVIQNILMPQVSENHFLIMKYH